MTHQTVRLLIEGQEVDFSEYPSLALVETNPLISGSQGSYTYPFTLPLSPTNNRLFDYPTRTARADELPARWDGELWVGMRRYTVWVSLTSIGEGQIGVSASVESGIMSEKFKNHKLSEYLQGEHTFANAQACIEYLSNPLFNGTRSEEIAANEFGKEKPAPLPPIDPALGMVDKIMLHYEKSKNDTSSIGDRSFVINRRSHEDSNGVTSGLYRTKERDYIDDTLQSLNPPGYGIVPFLRLEWVLRQLFGADFALKEVIPPGESDLLIANNVVDAIVKGTISYHQLAPDMSALDFIAAIEAYFGGKFVLQDGRPHFLTYCKWLALEGSLALDSYLMDSPVVSLREAKQLVLSMDNKFSGIKYEQKESSGASKSGPVGTKPPYDTIQDLVKVWPDFNKSIEGDFNIYYNQKYNRIESTTTVYEVVLKHDVFKTTYMGHNTLGYDPCFLPEKQEIKIPVTPPFSLVETLSFFVGVNWLNTTITNIEQKNEGKSDCLTFITERYHKSGFLSGPFAPMTWGQKGIYKTRYAEYDLFLRHANQKITAKISKEIKLDILGQYILGGQSVVVEQITDNINLPYYEVTFRTTRLLEPYDVEQETLQVYQEP